MSKIFGRLSFIRKINFFRFIKLNYFCKNIIRDDNSKIIPYKNSVLDISKDAKIYLKGGDIEVGSDLLRKSKAETRIRLRGNAVWKSENGCKITYGCTLEILPDAEFVNKYFTMNSNSVIIVADKITFGQDVMLGRNVIIYDSDHHQITDKEGNACNKPKPVIIGNHVWIATNAIALKGTEIGDNCVIAANAVVSGKIKSNTIFRTEYKSVRKENKGSWDRKSPDNI